MHSIQQLQSGELVGTTYIKISAELTSIPTSMYQYADTLEILDLSGNELTELPEDFFKFSKLRILFLSNNKFTVFPSVLSKLKHLDIVGLKANKINHIPENAVPISLRWLILTDNIITQLPASIGLCTTLQKVMLAGNALTTLPDEMANCVHIELLRISANQLTILPQWLFELPKLAWLAFAGNPLLSLNNELIDKKITTWDSLLITEQLGEGASGNIYKASIRETSEEVAVKVYKGAVTSDGYPADEMHACIHAGQHANLVPVKSIIVNHPESKTGLVLELIPPNYTNLGLPPNFETCTRDTFESNKLFSIIQIYSIARCIASVMQHLHQRGIAHGDLYAHNILVDENANALLSDFGAATHYEKGDKKQAERIEKIDVRAFGCLLDDLIQRSISDENSLQEMIIELKNRCLSENIDSRPSYNTVVECLKSKSFQKK